MLLYIFSTGSCGKKGSRDSLFLTCELALDEILTYTGIEQIGLKCTRVYTIR